VEPFRFALPPDPAALSELRRAVRDWLVGLEITNEDVASIAAACSEIAADGIETGRLELVGILAGGDVVVRCEGPAGWQIEDHPPRYVAALLVDDVSIERSGQAVSVVLRKAASRGLRL
jgi:hypothetical protein